MNSEIINIESLVFFLSLSAFLTVAESSFHYCSTKTSCDLAERPLEFQEMPSQSCADVCQTF